jgi:hypothetical protein
MMVLQGMHSSKHNLLFNSGRFVASMWTCCMPYPSDVYIDYGKMEQYAHKFWRDTAMQLLLPDSSIKVSMLEITTFCSLCYKRHLFKNYFCFIVTFSYYFISDWHESCYCRS